MKRTEIYKGLARWGRTAIVWLEDNKIVFDCSDEEYGPIEFSIDLLKTALDDRNPTVQTQAELIRLYESQIMDLTLMSKIELGDDVIAEIKRLKGLLNEQPR